MQQEHCEPSKSWKVLGVDPDGNPESFRGTADGTPAATRAHLMPLKLLISNDVTGVTDV
jgi:hypothetical protein